MQILKLYLKHPKHMHPYLLSCFTGEYDFTRVVSSPKTTINGVAQFQLEDATTYLYLEKGLYWLNEETCECYQTRYFVFGETSLQIQKQDRSALHTFRIPEDLTHPLILHHTHYCNHDSYTLSLQIDSEDTFQTCYKINGPFKKCMIKTIYTRISNKS